MMSLMVNKVSEENKIKEKIIEFNSKTHENVFFDRFENFLIMNTYDLALEEPRKAYEFLLKEVMKTNKKSVKENQESIKRMAIELVTLLVENNYVKVAKNLLTHLKSLEDQDDQDKNENEFLTREELGIVGSSEISNEGEKENDLDMWMKDKKNKILINFAYSFCADGEQKKAKSFLREHICLEKSEIIKDKREKILNEAMDYLNSLIKREIGTI